MISLTLQPVCRRIRGLFSDPFSSYTIQRHVTDNWKVGKESVLTSFKALSQLSSEGTEKSTVSMSGSECGISRIQVRSSSMISEKWMERKRSWPVFRYYSRICLAYLRETGWSAVGPRCEHGASRVRNSGVTSSVRQKWESVWFCGEFRTSCYEIRSAMVTK